MQLISKEKLLEEFIENTQPGIGQVGIKYIDDLIKSQPTVLDLDKLKDILMEYFDIGDSYTYNLTRVKSAFEVGTVSLDDFEEFTEEIIDDMVEFVERKLVDE